MPRSRLIAIIILTIGLNMMPGVFVAAFVIARLGLPCSSSICIPTLAMLFFGGLILFFVGFGLLQCLHIAGWWRGRRNPNGGITHCGICQEEIPKTKGRVWQNPHYNTVHLQYAIWLRTWHRNIFAMLILSTFVLVVSDLLYFSYGGRYLYAAITTNLLFFALILFYGGWVLQSRQKRFIREWSQNPKA